MSFTSTHRIKYSSKHSLNVNWMQVLYFNSFRGYSLNFFSPKRYFKNKKNLKQFKRIRNEKNVNENKKIISLFIEIICFANLSISFRHYYYYSKLIFSTYWIQRCLPDFHFTGKDKKFSLNFNFGWKCMYKLEFKITSSRILYVYTPSQKFNTIRNSELRNIKINKKKLNHIEEVKNVYFA